ncbi:MAG: ABC transporter permease [Actinomyces sp.]|uniref:ABC transporter permease n=1 Tax=Actinomyces sp. TaxID=29317 RepID=UPI0026DB33DE|nr:ABC transporter permease [Actinomyces sp.]MDO4243154.1 ABC transporter permease [Actinomyces sp.]
MSSAETTASTGTTGSGSHAMSRRQEIALVAGRELRTQLFKKATLVSTAIMVLLIVVGIIVAGRLSGGEPQPYRLGVAGTKQQAAALIPSLTAITGSNGEAVEVVDLTGTDGQAALSEDDNPVDMVLDLSGEPRLLVQEEADEAVAAGVTGIMQQAALSDQITALGGDPASVASTLATAAPEVVVLDPPRQDQEDFGPRYTVFMIVNMIMYFVMLGGGQLIAQGVVEEKSSRIVEILLACVRPTSLLAGKVLGIGVASIVSTAVLALAGVVTAKIVGILPEAVINLDAVFVAMLVWMVVGFSIFAIAFGAAGALVSRQEDVGSATMPLIMLCVVPFILAMVMILGDPSAMVWQVLAFVPPLSAFLMPARLIFGVSGWIEQALAIALAFLPLLVRVAAGIYTRAVTRMGARVPLKEVLRRPAA